MKRFSITWWLAILPSTIIVGAPVFLLLGHETEWGIPERLAVALVCALLVDIAVAAWLQRIAPTQVRIGPGERATHSEIAAEQAIVLSGFKASPEGRVSVRGETWTAIRRPNDTADLAAGTAVSVVDRIGLNLVIAPRSD